MKIFYIIPALMLLLPGMARGGGMIDDPLLGLLLIDQLELRSTDSDTSLAWDGEGWVGWDLNKLWLKTDGEYVDDHVDEAELQALYSRAIAPFWDVQVGWRRDIQPSPERDWVALGVKGLAPYFFDIDVAVFVGDSGRTSARLQAEYEFLLTQRLILVPDIELNLYGRDDPATRIGSGLSDIEAGLRLRYEIRREFAPYIGLNWIHLYGGTADFAREEGADIDDFQLIFGVRSWF
jgi:copper resistance protein B